MQTNKKSIQTVRQVVQLRLEELSRGSGKFRETYMFRDNRLEGVRFQQGIFSAVWQLDQPEVAVLRNEQQILLIDLNSARSARKKTA